VAVTPYQPTLHRLPDDTPGRFQILREFLRRWHGHDTGTVGRTVDRIGAAESTIKKQLPLGVREWIVLLDDIDRLDVWGEVLRDCWGLRKVPGCPAFALLTAGEDDQHWGPMLRDLAVEDPPVHTFHLDYDSESSRFKRSGPVAPRVSTWAIEFILSYLHLSRSVQFERLASEATLDRLQRTTEPLVRSRIGDTELVEFTDGLIHATADGQGMYQLRCYAPFRPEANAAPRDAARALRERVEAMLGATDP